MVKNSELTKEILKKLQEWGVKEICLCSGARNAPFISLLNEASEFFKIYSFFEERSAAFFALGKIRQKNLPVAVITTSGTAAGELLPATMEAYYSGAPLILITADRPHHYRGTGSPQTAEQKNLFGIYVSQCLDIDHLDDFQKIKTHPGRMPIHLNVCFEEPLLLNHLEIQENLDEFRETKNFYSVDHKSVHRLVELNESIKDFTHFKDPSLFTFNYTSPIAVVGMLQPDERDAVRNLLTHLQIPVYLESISGLREDINLQKFRIFNCEKILERAAKKDYFIDGVLRIGNVPTSRLWRDLESHYNHLDVTSLSSLPFTGLSRPSSFYYGSIEMACKKAIDQKYFFNNALTSFLEMECNISKQLKVILEKEPYSEPGIFYQLSQSILRLKKNTKVYLGNSLPIREWDLAADCISYSDIWASRGLNGIDGQISTYLGFAQKDYENWGIIGDLTALYDLSSLWILNQMKEIKINLIIINNGGGKLFSRMFPQKAFQNTHNINFEHWSKLWNVQYEKWNDNQKVEIKISQENRIIEIIPNEESTERFWKMYNELVQSFL